MMATTHVLIGVALASVASILLPELSTIAVAAAVAGSVFPDLDLYAGHRKTLHYPSYCSALAVGAVAVASVVPTAITVGVACFVLAAAAHATMDVLGGGLELEPWRAESDRAVYDHLRGRWIAPRRWIRYDGAPEDLALAGVLGLPALAVYDGPIRLLVLGTLAVSLIYALTRKRLPAVARRLIATLPVRLVEYVPRRFVDGTGPRRPQA